MYLERLHIQNFKLIGDIELSFLNAEDFVDEHGVQHKKGEPRMWTVLIGKNARGKTSILQAIALAMSNEATANLLVDGRVPSLKRLDTNEEMLVRTSAYTPHEENSLRFDLRINEQRLRHYPEMDDINLATKIIFDVLVQLSSDEREAMMVRANADFLIKNPGNNSLAAATTQMMVNTFLRPMKQLDESLEKLTPDTNFIVAYGTNRSLPLPNIIHSEDPSRHRLQPLFSSSHQINGTNFIEHLRAVDRTPNKAMSTGYLDILEKLLASDLGILPEVKAFRARGKGEIPEEDYLALEHRVVTNIGGREIEVPTTWLSQGYQAMFSWMADMIGWACLEQKRAVKPDEIEGIALIDEIDLFLHPTWQVNLVPMLRKVFPKVQFVVTTHSPLVLSSLRPEEIVILELDEAGELVAHNGPGEVPDPRLRTMGELASEFFAINRLYPKALDDMWNEYRRIANDPHRTDEEQARGEHLLAQINAQGKKPSEMVARAEVERDGWEE